MADDFKKVISIRKGCSGLKVYSWKGDKEIVRRIARRGLKQRMSSIVDESKGTSNGN